MASFGTLSKLYYNFADNNIKKGIARDFNLPQHEVLESWMRSVSALRNYCAHHARLWNRYFNAAPQINANFRGNWITNYNIDSNKLQSLLFLFKQDNSYYGEYSWQNIIDFKKIYYNIILPKLPLIYEHQPIQNFTVDIIMPCYYSKELIAPALECISQ